MLKFFLKNQSTGRKKLHTHTESSKAENQQNLKLFLGILMKLIILLLVWIRTKNKTVNHIKNEWYLQALSRL